MIFHKLSRIGRLPRNLSTLLKKHLHMFAVAVIIGLIVAGPNLFFTQQHGYKGIPIMYTDFESFYLSRINGAYNGCIMSCNPFIDEYGNKYPFFDPSISEYLLAIPGILFGLSVIKLKLIYEFLLPFCLSIVTYSLLHRLIRHKLLAIVGTVYILLGFTILNSISIISFSDIFRTISLKSPLLHEPLLYSRIVNPTFSSILFFVFLGILLSCFHRKKISNFIFLGIILGILAYIYLFAFFFSIMIICICILVSIVLKNGRSILFLLSTIVGLSISLPIVYNLYSLMHHPLVGSVDKYTSTYSHLPNINIFWLIIFIASAILFVLFKRKNPDWTETSQFVFALILTCFASNNQHIITGVVIQYFHFDWYYITPIFVILILYVVDQFAPNRILNRYYLVIIIIGLIPILQSILAQRQLYLDQFDNSIYIQRFVPILDFLRNTIPENSTIIAPSEFENILTVFTHTYLIWSSNANFYLHEPTRESDAFIALSSMEAMKTMVNRYNVTYAIFNLDSLPNNLSMNQLGKSIYKDQYYITYKLRRTDNF